MTTIIHNHKLSLAIDHIPKSKHEKARQRATNQEERLHNTAKHLGVNINSKLSWNHHVDAITKKANSTLAFLRCNTSNCMPKTSQSILLSNLYQTYTRICLHCLGPNHQTKYIQTRNGAEASSQIRTECLAVWWSQIRPVQDSYESGTATVALPDSYRGRIRLCY